MHSKKKKKKKKKQIRKRLKNLKYHLGIKAFLENH